MKTRFLVKIGCYLETAAHCVDLEHDENLSYVDREDFLANYFWQSAYEMTEGWVGMHGFAVDEEWEDDEDALNELINEATEVDVSPWDEDSYGNFVNTDDIQVQTVKWKRGY